MNRRRSFGRSAGVLLSAAFLAWLSAALADDKGGGDRDQEDQGMGWDEYFLRQHYPVYLVDQVSRARSGFDATTYNEVRMGQRPPDQLPNVLRLSHETGWTWWRVGPKPGVPFADTQFPVEAVEEFQNLVQSINKAGGDATLLHLPEIGIRGNSHFLMFDKNNLQIADLILEWMDRHVKR